MNKQLLLIAWMGFGLAACSRVESDDSQKTAGGNLSSGTTSASSPATPPASSSNLAAGGAPALSADHAAVAGQAAGKDQSGGKDTAAAVAPAPAAAPAQQPQPAVKLDVERFAPDEVQSELERECAHLDPLLDGYDTEVLNSTAGKALSTLIQGLSKPLDPAVLEQFVAEDFECKSLRMSEARSRYSAGGLQIDVGAGQGKTYSGREGFVEALHELGASFAHADSAHGSGAHHGLHAKFKIKNITVHSPAEADTGLIYLAFGEGDEGEAVVQQDGHWLARWDTSAGYKTPRLKGIEIEDFTESTVARTLFSDCTISAFPDEKLLDRIRHGIQSWWGRIDTGMGFSLYGDYALALGDVDGDGLEDVYLCLPGSLPNLLLRHRPDGTLEDITTDSGTDYLDDTPSAVFADMDNDGHQDLVLATLLTLDFLKGDGKGKFNLASVHPTDNAVSLSVADYDSDGLLDVYICRYSSTNRGTGAGDTIYDSDQGKPNVLLRNEGSFVFRDTTEESGISHNNNRFSFSGVWEDYDADGDLDLYVANDFGRNNLYRNDSGRFRDVASEAGAEDRAAGMGVTWGDYDLDGHVDLYVSNMFSSAGGRIVDKNRTEELAGSDAIAPLARFAKGNTMLRNRGDGTFEDTSFQAGVTMARWSWGGEFLDLNNDGWQDLMVPNGFVTNTSSSDL